MDQPRDAWLELRAPAKINLYLEVLGRRPDGYHELVTEMACISLADRLAFRVRSGTIDGTVLPAPGFRGSLPGWDGNLVKCALMRLRDAAGINAGMEVVLEKRIPVEGGLGGGSSDAAAALIAGNFLWGIRWPVERLMEVGATLGSDVPFFLSGGRAICRGRGELVTPLDPVSGVEVIVAQPPAGLSTPAVYAELANDQAWLGNQAGNVRKEQRSGAGTGQEVLEAAGSGGDLTGVGQSFSGGETGLATLLDRSSGPGVLGHAGVCLFNRLEPAAGRLSPWPGLCRQIFEGTGCRSCQLSGSGTCFFGLYEGSRAAARAMSRMSARFPQIRFFRCRTVRGISLRRKGLAFADPGCR